MKKKIKVLIKRAGKPPVVGKIWNDRKTLEKIAGGAVCYSLYPELPEGTWLVGRCEYEYGEKSIPNVRFSDGIIYDDFIILTEDSKERNAALNPKRIKESMKLIEGTAL